MTSILIVEDEMIIAREIEEQLKNLNYEVIGITTSSEEALKLLNKSTPDLILMDIIIQGKKDGIELAEEVNQKYQIPIVFVTANTDESIVERAKKTKPCGFVVKPFTVRELSLNIEIALYKNQMEKKMKKMEHWYATHDSLTKLYNRHFLDYHFEKSLKKSLESNTLLCVMMIDIDNFKLINDSYGHLAGDNVLRSLADFLRANFRKDDIICRYGGEEFFVILPNINLKAATQIADILLQRIRNSQINCGEVKIQIYLSVGIAVYPFDGTTLDSLIKASDDALYHAKKNGKNRLSIFSCIS